VKGEKTMAVFDEPEIRGLIERRDWTALRDKMSLWRVPDIADLISELDKEYWVLLFRSLPRSIAASVFSEFDAQDQEDLLRELTDEEARHIISSLKPDDRTAILEELPGQMTQKLLNLLSPEDLREARQLLGYPEGSVGRLMTPDYVAVRPNWTVEEAMQHIRKKGRDMETINVVYVTDKAWHLIGVVSLRQLVLAKPSDLVSSTMTTPAVSLSAFADGEEAARTVDKYSLFILPVIDSDGVLVGIVTGDDILEMATKEATEDFHKGGAITPLKIGFGEAGIGLLYKSRIGWLMILALVDLISASLISRFEHAISQVLTLAFFMPMLLNSGGNAGAQSSTLIIRDLATGDAKHKDWLYLIVKEICIALALGLTIGLTVWGPSVFQGGPAVGRVVALSGVAIVTISSVTGVVVPMLMSKMGLDPASSSTPMITSVVDIFGVIIYFNLAVWYLNL
jgi:magnesium transporter